MRLSVQFPAVLLVAAVLLMACRASGPSDAVGQRASLTSELVGAANLIIVGRIVGLADNSPGAQSRRQFEMHLIDVEQTLKGSEHTGQRLAARPDGHVWEDGAAYVLLLRSAPGNVVTALPPPLKEATEEQIALVRRLVQERGEGVTERRALWMSHTGGWGSGTIAEFFATASGRFEWRRRVDPDRPAESVFETLTGSLPSEEVLALVRQIQETDPGQPVDDADVAVFGWLGENNERQAKACSMPSRTACSAVLQAIERLARRYAGSGQVSF